MIVAALKKNKTVKDLADWKALKSSVNKDLDPEFLTKNLEKMPPEVIAAMIEAATGEPVLEENPQKLMQMLGGLDDDTYKEALIAMNPDARRLMVMNMYQQDDEVMQLFPADAYTNMMAILEKPDMMVSVNALQNETLINMNSELPPELMSIVLTQMDPKDFAEIIIRQYPELLSQIVAV